MKRSHATDPQVNSKTARFARVLTAALIAVVCLLIGSSAWALSLDDLKKMSSSGLDDNTIISIIENSGDRFQIDEATEKDLRDAGISDRVINALKATAPQGGDANPDGGDGTIPAPAGQGNLGKMISQGARTAKQSFDIASATVRKIKEEKQNEAKSAQMQLAFQDVENITKDFDGADHWKALAVCHNFLVEYAPAKNSDEYYESTWCKGAAFDQLGLHNSAASLLLEVMLIGADRPRFAEALNALIRSADNAGYYPASFAQLDTLYIEDKPRAVQDKFNYFLGKFFGDVLGNYERGIELLGRVGSDSNLYPKALYAKGVMHANPDMNQYKTAVESFQQAILAAEGDSSADNSNDIIELAYLALARVAYEAANYDGALYYYNKVDRFSSRYPRALFEQAWTYFLKGDSRNALGTFHSVSSPYYDGYYYPDLWVLEATVYLNLCRYDLAKASLQTFKDQYLTKLPLLTTFLVSQQDPKDYYLKVQSMLASRSQGGTELPPIFLEAVLSDIEFYNLYKVVSQIEGEVAVLEGVQGQLGAYGDELVTDLQSLRDKKLLEAGLKTQNVLKKIEDELNDWDVTMTEVSIEIDIAEKELDQQCLQLAAQGKPCEFEAEEATVLFLVADDWQFWPFEGEYWVDEVGNYKSYLGDRCRQVEKVASGDEAE